VRIELRELADFARDHKISKGDIALFNHYLRHLLGEWEVAAFADELFRQIRKDDGHTLFVLDGLDEVPTEQRQMIVDMVNDLKTNYRHHHYLVTCRPYAYIGQEWKLIDFKEATLAPFNKEQIAQFSRNWYLQLEKLDRLDKGESEKGAKDLQDQIDDLHLLHLAENPLLLTAMTHLHVTKHHLPGDRVGLYNEIVALLYER
jgi:predicted NACHT family NTPase